MEFYDWNKENIVSFLASAITNNVLLTSVTCPNKFYNTDASADSVCYEEKLADVLLAGHYIYITYDEDDVHMLTLDKMIKQFPVFVKECPRDYLDLSMDNADLITYDSLMQIILFGEIVYR